MIQSHLKLRQPFLSKNILFFTALLAFLFVFIYSAPELLAQEAADETSPKRSATKLTLQLSFYDLVPLPANRPTAPSSKQDPI